MPFINTHKQLIIPFLCAYYCKTLHYFEFIIVNIIRFGINIFVNLFKIRKFFYIGVLKPKTPLSDVNFDTE